MSDKIGYYTDVENNSKPNPEKMKRIRGWMKHVLRTHANLSRSRTCFDAENHALNMLIALKSLTAAVDEVYMDPLGIKPEGAE